MVRKLGYVLGIVLAALIQVRLLPELGLERLVNLPLVLVIVTASIERRTLALVAATTAGLVIDTTLLRPLGLTSLAMVVGVVVASQVRGAGNTLLVRRTMAFAFGLMASNITVFILSGGENGRPGEGVAALVANLLVGAALAWVGLRRRSRYQFDPSLRG
jgi:cell shape-determining protein MreD